VLVKAEEPASPVAGFQQPTVKKTSRSLTRKRTDRDEH
jgi:hypothetical protein